MDDAVESYLTELARTEHEEPVLVEMEARAAEHRFPIVGRATGRFLELVARAVGARRVMELGSGYGYSAYWFARAVGPDGEVVCTDGDPENARLAEHYLSKAGLWDRVRYRVGDALHGFARKRATSTSCTATSTRTVTPTAGARRVTASESVVYGCVTTRSGAAASQPEPTRRTVRLPPSESTTGW
jgi:hypothetical protein